MLRTAIRRRHRRAAVRHRPAARGAGLYSRTTFKTWAAARCASGVCGTEAASSPIRPRAVTQLVAGTLILGGVGCRDEQL